MTPELPELAPVRRRETSLYGSFRFSGGGACLKVVKPESGNDRIDRPGLGRYCANHQPRAAAPGPRRSVTGLIGGDVASGCSAFNAHSFGATGSLGGGLEFPGGASLSAGPFIGLGAHNPHDLGGPFTYAGANGADGFLFGADFAGGRRAAANR